MSAATTEHAPLLSPIPAPPDFPVTWEHAEDESLFWTLLAPDPVLPLIASIIAETTDSGMRAVARAYELPLIGQRSRRINTYVYFTMPPVEAPPEELAAQSQRSQEKVRATMARVGELWETDWLPEIKGHLAFWETFDRHGATMRQLLAHFDETVARARRLWELHFQLLIPALSLSLFEELYRDLFEGATTFDAYRLLEGFENKTLERDRGLWELSRKALASPAVLKVLQEHAPADVPAELEGFAEGRVFLAELHTFLAEYGYLIVGLEQPSWIEDPTPAIQNLQDYVGQPDRDLLAEMAGVALERERSVAVARDRLQEYPQPVVEQFEFLLKAAQQAIVLTEDHTYWIDQRGMYHLRQVVLEFGRRLAEAGVIAGRDDVFCLSLDELRETAAQVTGTEVPGTSVSEATVPGTWRQLVAERRAEMEHFAAITPPPALGTLPAGPPPDDPLTRTLGKFFGTPPRPPETPTEVRGHPGSPGKVRGPARVVRSLAEAGRLQPGDVLVTRSTMPAWTPLFVTATALVTDTGGILSHGAVVAREYRIPAVVGAGVATQVIQDGQMVEVDGDAGVVRILSSDGEKGGIQECHLQT